VCHFITGVVIWGQWAPEGMGKYLYSLLYNGQYMLPELIITVVLAAVLINIPQMRKVLNLPEKK
ncbi:MAG: energy-coupled thiamine transporter ThiT, partial [Clostridia bacterium]|nr:energy-coupled thiamine transporter ThiT [Clostridia bacterium]